MSCIYEYELVRAFPYRPAFQPHIGEPNTTESSNKYINFHGINNEEGHVHNPQRKDKFLFEVNHLSDGSNIVSLRKNIEVFTKVWEEILSQPSKRTKISFDKVLNYNKISFEKLKNDIKFIEKIPPNNLSIAI